MFRIIMAVILAAVALPAVAQDAADWRFGGDAYVAGRNVTVSGDAVDDLFAAGDKVTSRGDVEGSAHMAGRYVTLEGRVGENLYGMGMEIDVEAPVAGNVTIMGQTLRVVEPVSGNLRAAGSSVELSAPVAGNAIVAGERVSIDAAIMGDLALAAEDIEWGEGARVEGTLNVYAEDPDDVDVPDRVASAEQVRVYEAEAFESMEEQRPGFFGWLRGWLGGILFIGVLGTIFGALAPKQLAGLRERVLDRPVRTGLIGFGGLSALLGSVVFLALTGIGLLLVPVSLIATVLLAIAGYVIGTYSIGVWATGVAGRPEPKTTGDRAVAAFSGAAIGALIGLVPWLGWLAVMAIFLIGAGAVVVRLMRPAFGVDDGIR